MAPACETKPTTQCQQATLLRSYRQSTAYAGIWFENHMFTYIATITYETLKVS